MSVDAPHRATVRLEHDYQFVVEFDTPGAPPLVLDEPLTLGMAVGFPLVILGSFLGTMKSRAAPVPGTAAAPSASAS